MNVLQLVPVLPAFDPLDFLAPLVQAAGAALSWLYGPLSGNDWMGIAGIDLISPGLGIFARWLEVSPAPRRMAWRRLRFLFAAGQVLSALAAAKYLPGFFIPPYGLMALLHGLCLAAQVRAVSALRDAPAA